MKSSVYLATMLGGFCGVSVEIAAHGHISIGNTLLVFFISYLSANFGLVLLRWQGRKKLKSYKPQDVAPETPVANPQLVGYLRAKGWSEPLTAEQQEYIKKFEAVKLQVLAENPTGFMVKLNDNKD